MWRVLGAPLKAWKDRRETEQQPRPKLGEVTVTERTVTPSPVNSTFWPCQRSIVLWTTRWCCSRSFFHARSPIAAAT